MIGRVVKLLLILATSFFVSYHTQIFITHIEPNPILAWLIAVAIEGFLVVLAMTRTLVARVLMVPLYLISVIASSASFIAVNEEALQRFLTQGKVIEQVEHALAETKKAYTYGEKYTTKTLARQRKLEDKLIELYSMQGGEIALTKAVIFLVLVAVLQVVSLYVASSLKTMETVSETVSETAETVSETMETTETVSETVTETMETVPRNGSTPHHGELPHEEKLRIAEGLRNLNVPLSEIARRAGVAKSNVSKAMNYPKYHVSEEIFRKLKALL